MESSSIIPTVMSFAPSDPTGGAGIQADIETLFGLGCHCCPIITGIAVQNTTNLQNFTAAATTLLIQQARIVLDEMPIAAFKVAVMGNIENFAAIYTVLKDFPPKPVVLSIPPGALGTLDNPDTDNVNAVWTLLCPLTTVLILDTESAHILAPGADTIAASAQKLMSTGCEYVLIKNCHATPTTIENSLYSGHRLLEKFVWQRVEGNYHGCGCTLSAATAGLLAHGLHPMESILEAQKYTLECIKRGVRLGIGGYLPDRLFWARNRQKISEKTGTDS